MIAKILSSTSTFNAVSYNSKKTESSKGELMKLTNFGYLEFLNGCSPEEVKNFLIAHSSRNNIVKDRQFHATLSCKGNEFNKHQLTEIADKWMAQMGYGKNPYLVVFHNDTNNNHVHIVSSRVGPDGKKINDSFEKVRAVKTLNEIIGIKPENDFQNHLKSFENFSFSTQKQAQLFFENLGYSTKDTGSELVVFKYGTEQGKVSISQIEAKIGGYQSDKKRISQLKAIMKRYMASYSAIPEPLFEPTKSKQGKQIGYRSDLSDFLAQKFGLKLIFHGKEGKAPYGYTLIDFQSNLIMKGSEILPLKEMMNSKLTNPKRLSKTGLKEQDKEFKAALVSSITDFSSIREGLLYHNINLYTSKGQLKVASNQGAIYDVEKLSLPDNVFSRIFNYKSNPKESFIMLESKAEVLPQLTIADDVDDEAIHGRGRRRKRKSDRKNTR